MLKETVHFKNRSQVTIPKEFVERLGLKQGDILEARLEDGKIILVPVVAVPKDQAWYWTEQWQQEEREADEQIKRGEVTEPMELNEVLRVLDHVMKDEP